MQILEAEERKLEVLKRSREQVQQLTDASREILEKLQRRLQRLYQTLEPIRDDTHKIATAEKNIDSSLAEVQKVMTYHTFAQERLEDVRIRVQQSTQEEFLSWVKSINEAVQYFKMYNFRNSERLLKKFKEISRIALQKMEADLSNQLNGYTKDSFRKMYDQRNYLRQKHEIINGNDLYSIQDLARYIIRPDQMSQIANICRIIEKTSVTNGLGKETKYSLAVWKSRREALLITLRNFNADRLYITEDYMRITACDPTGVDERTEDRAGFFIKFLIVFFQLVQVERSILESIFNETESEKAKFSKSFNQMLEAPINYLEEFMERNIIDKKEYEDESRCLVLLQVIRRWKKENGNYAGVLYFEDIPRNNAPWLQIEALLSRCEQCVIEDVAIRLKLLSDFANEKMTKKKESESSGGYHRMTIETTNLLVKIYDYKLIVDAICKKHDSPYRDTVHLIQDVQSKLLESLKTKAKSFKHGPLRCIFLLNNIHFIVHRYQDTDLESVASIFVENCKREIVLQKDQYQTSTWTEMSNLLVLEGAPLYPRPKPNNVKIEKKDLSRNDIQQIKHRCRSFFTKFDDELAKQRQYHVPDATLRHTLIAKNIEYMVDDYECFFDHYRYIEFTSESSKYLHWTPKSFEKMLNSFFEVSRAVAQKSLK